jgi:hypothetical protein
MRPQPPNQDLTVPINLTARGLYTLLTDPDIVGQYLFENLCKGHVASLCNHTSVVWYGALQIPHGWVQSSSELLRYLW